MAELGFVVELDRKQINWVYFYFKSSSLININGIGTSNNIGSGRGSNNSNMIEIIEIS